MAVIDISNPDQKEELVAYSDILYGLEGEIVGQGQRFFEAALSAWADLVEKDLNKGTGLPTTEIEVYEWATQVAAKAHTEAKAAWISVNIDTHGTIILLWNGTERHGTFRACVAHKKGQQHAIVTVTWRTTNASAANFLDIPAYFAGYKIFAEAAWIKQTLTCPPFTLHKFKRT